MKPLLLGLLASLPGLPALAQPTPTRTDTLAIHQLIDTYLTGVAHRDSTAVGRTLAPDAIVWRIRQGASPPLSATRPVQLLILSKLHPAGEVPPVAYQLRYLAIAEAAASAFVTELVAAGQCPATCATHTFDLTKLPQGWQIRKVTTMPHAGDCP